MAVTLRIKRSQSTITPGNGTLQHGELAYSEVVRDSEGNIVQGVGGTLYYGGADGVPVKIGGLSDVKKLAASTASATPNTLVQRDENGSIAVNDITVEGNTNFNGDQTTTGNSDFAGDVTITGDLTVNGGDILTAAADFNLLNTVVERLNIGGEAQTVRIGGVDTVTNFAGDVNIGGSLTVAESSTVNADFTANQATITGDFAVNGNTRLGDDPAVDTTTINGVTEVNTSRTRQAAQDDFVANGEAALKDALKITDTEGTSIFEVKDNGDTLIAGVLNVTGEGTSTFAGDVAIGGSITVAEDATVTADFTADTVTVEGNLTVKGNTQLGDEDTDTTTVNGDMSTSRDVNVGRNLTVAGDLTVNGTTTTVNTEQTVLTDPVITLAQDTSADDSFDRGIDFKWHDGSDVKTGFFGFDDADQKFKFIPESTTTDGVYSGTLGAFKASVFEGALVGNADTASKLQTPVNVSLSGTVAGTVSFDGSGDVNIVTAVQENTIALGTHTTGKYAEEVRVSGLGLSRAPETENSEDGTIYTVVSNATVAADADTLVYRDSTGRVNAAGFTAESEQSRFKAGISGLAEDGTTQTELTDFVIDGGEF